MNQYQDEGGSPFCDPRAESPENLKGNFQKNPIGN